MKDEKNKILTSIIILLVILIILITILVYVNKNASKNKKTANITISNDVIQTDANYNEITANNMKEKLINMTERGRMEYYVSNFINLVEKKKYEEAYDLLYTDFQKNYFPTAGQFENYVKKEFPSMGNLEFDNIERNGNTYILWVTIKDLINGKKDDAGKEYTFVVRENDVNDIDLSFNVTEE